MSQNDRTQLIPDPQQPSRHTGGVQSPRPIAPSHGQQRGAANASQRPNQQRQQRQQRQANGNAPKQSPTHARGDRGPTRKPAENNKSGKKTTLFVVLGLIIIVYVVGVVAFSQVAYPNTAIAGVDVSFSNASSAATKVNSAWKHYKLTVTGDDFSWAYQPESDEPIVDGERNHQPQRSLCMAGPPCGILKRQGQNNRRLQRSRSRSRHRPVSALRHL